MNPTKEQWFWEKCGLSYFDGWYYSPEGERLFEYNKEIGLWALPYLFEYAIPKLTETQKARLPGMFSHDGVFTFNWFWDNPALALFWAIYKAFRVEDSTSEGLYER